MTKYYLVKKGHGKVEHYVPTPINSKKKLNELTCNGIETFDTRQHALNRALELKGC